MDKRTKLCLISLSLIVCEKESVLKIYRKNDEKINTLMFLESSLPTLRWLQIYTTYRLVEYWQPFHNYLGNKEL